MHDCQFINFDEKLRIFHFDCSDNSTIKLIKKKVNRNEDKNGYTETSKPNTRNALG